MTDSAERSGGIQVIARAAQILRMLAEHTEGQSLGAIAGQVGLARSTVQRIVQALEFEGFVEPVGPGGGFRLGPSLSELVFRRQSDIVAEVRPLMEETCAELGESIALYALTGSNLIAIDRCIAEKPLRVVFPLGAIPYPPHLLAPGQAILAELSHVQLSQILEEYVDESEIPDIVKSLADHRDAAHDAGTFIPELSGFAVPLHTHLGLYSIAVIVPTSRVGIRDEAIFAALRSCRDKVEAKIGDYGDAVCHRLSCHGAK